MAAVSDVAQNPQNMHKYKDNKKVCECVCVCVEVVGVCVCARLQYVHKCRDSKRVGALAAGERPTAGTGGRQPSGN